MATKDTETFSGDSYIAITNIPSRFHTADLRAYFADFIEDQSFTCFHFRHRPEKPKEANTNSTLMTQNSSSQPQPSSSSSSNYVSNETTMTNMNGKSNDRIQTTNVSYCCCVAKIKSSQLTQFLERYNNQNWTDDSNEYSEDICSISVIHTENTSKNSINNILPLE